MTKSIYIHIGPHKTGTTTLQFSLFLNKDKLKKNGILYPDSGIISAELPGHHNLAWEILGDERFQKKSGTWKNLLDEITSSKEEMIILSTENFSAFNPEDIQKVKNLLKDFDIHVIAYMRRQDFRLQSKWAVQQVNTQKMGQYDPFPIWLDKKPGRLKYFDYDVLLNKWEDAFGIERIVLRVLENSQLSGSLFNDMLTACHVPDPDQYPISENKNLSPGIKEIVLFQELKKMQVDYPKEEVFNALFKAIHSYAKQAGWSQQKWSVIDRDLYNRISQYYEESNRRVARKFFSREELFFEPYNDLYLTHFSIQDFPPEELVDIMTFITNRLLTEESKPDIMSEGRGLQEKITSLPSSLKKRLSIKPRID